jgi:hypothetical protein
MRGIVSIAKTLMPLLLLVLGACQGLSGLGSNSAGAAASPQGGTTTSSSSQVQTLQAVSSTASTVSQVGNVMGNPAVALGGAAVAAVADALGTRASSPSAAAALQVAANKRFDYADVYTDLGDPTGMRALVPYLMKPEVWTLIQCEMPSPTSRHYRFQKISTGADRPLPEVDIFKTNR